LVGIVNDKPYEVFAGKNGVLDKEYKTGIIVKKRKGFYQLTDDEGDVLLSPITGASSEHEETITRLASLSLQGSNDIHHVVRQLEKVNGSMQGFSKSLARALKRYIPDGTKEHGETCPQCSSNAIVRQEGCKYCKQCSWSACL